MDFPTNQGVSDKLTKLLNEKKSAREHQLRKHSDWTENYELYRNKVRTNRLTQRQTVGIPLMKETITTLLSKEDDNSVVKWNEKSGDELKTLIYQEMWEQNARDENLELKDIIDKKNVKLYGISTTHLNLHKKGVSIDVEDVFNVVYDPLTNPLDIETARFIVKQNIFKPLREVLADDRYSEAGKEELKVWLATDKGMIQSGKNKQAWEESMKRLQAMGVYSDQFPLYAGGDVLVNLTEHYTNLWDTKAQKFVRHVVTYADDTIELLDETLKELIGIEEWPFDFWTSDTETNDIYPDGIADMVRPINKIVNIWYSQQVENRTLQNFQMHWFDATQPGYTPQTYEPGPGRMLPAPGDPSKTIMPVQINGLDETFNAINFLTNIVERASGATALEKGEPEQGAQTLGEVQILVGKATERAKTEAKFYKAARYRVARKWNLLMQANSFPKVTLYRTASSGKIYEKTVYTSDWKGDYEPTVESSSEHESDEVQSLQKFSYVMQQYPNNPALKRIMQQRSLKLLDLSAAELKEVEEAQKQADEMEQQALLAGSAPQPTAQPQPEPQQGVDPNQLAELSQLLA